MSDEAAARDHVGVDANSEPRGRRELEVDAERSECRCVRARGQRAQVGARVRRDCADESDLVDHYGDRPERAAHARAGRHRDLRGGRCRLCRLAERDLRVHERDRADLDIQRHIECDIGLAAEREACLVGPHHFRCEPERERGPARRALDEGVRGSEGEQHRGARRAGCTGEGEVRLDLRIGDAALHRQLSRRILRSRCATWSRCPEHTTAPGRRSPAGRSRRSTARLRRRRRRSETARSRSRSPPRSRHRRRS